MHAPLRSVSTVQISKRFFIQFSLTVLLLLLSLYNTVTPLSINTSLKVHSTSCLSSFHSLPLVLSPSLLEFSTFHPPGVLHSRSSEPYKLYVYALTSSFGANVTAIKASSLHWRQKQNKNSSRSAQNHNKMVDKSKKTIFHNSRCSLISEIWKTTCNG